MPSITEAEILDALVTASAAPKDAKTTEELSELHGITRDRVKRALRALARENRLTSHRVVRTAIDGRQMSVPAYTIAPKRGKGK